MRDIMLRNLGDLDFDLSRTLKARDVIYYKRTNVTITITIILSLHYYNYYCIIFNLLQNYYYHYMGTYYPCNYFYLTINIFYQ